MKFAPLNFLKICLLIALLLVAAMSLTSNYNRHPDEIHHFEAAKYYKYHFLPPEIGDESVRDSYSVYGVSYLNYHWAEYFYAGKFALLISPLIRDELLAVRFSNAFLFALLAGWFIFRAGDDDRILILPAFLLVTPQIWYVFSYANNDAFALFVTFIIAYQIAFQKSPLNRFLSAENFPEHLSGGALFGLLLGLLLICKANYWVFLVFTALWLVFAFPFNAGMLKKYAFLALIALSVLTFRVGLDFYVNGETNFVGFAYLNKFAGNLEARNSKLLTYQEKMARYDTKPSTLENDLQNSHNDLKLREKGLPLKELFTRLEWDRLTFWSFAGGYGYMDVFATRKFYRNLAVLYILFVLSLVAAIVRRKDWQGAKQLALTFFGSILTVLISIFLSWVYAFQPQGRYLFPILPMFALFAYSNRRQIWSFVLYSFIFLSFLFSVYSFVFVALAKINSIRAIF